MRQQRSVQPRFLKYQSDGAGLSSSGDVEVPPQQPMLLPGGDGQGDAQLQPGLLQVKKTLRIDEFPTFKAVAFRRRRLGYESSGRRGPGLRVAVPERVASDTG